MQLGVVDGDIAGGPLVLAKVVGHIAQQNPNAQHGNKGRKPDVQLAKLEQ